MSFDLLLWLTQVRDNYQFVEVAVVILEFKDLVYFQFLLWTDLSDF